MKQIILTLLCLPVILSAQIDNTQTITKTGTSIAQFLKISADPRGAAMGNAFVAMNGGPNSMFWNPSGMASVHGIEVDFVSHDWLVDMRYTYLGLAINARPFGVLGLAITNLSVPDDLVRTVEKPEGTGELFNAQGLAVNISLARSLTDRFSLGGSIKYISERIWHSKATSWAVDVGALFIMPIYDLRLGACISNYGNDMSMDGRDLKISVDPDPDNIGNVSLINALYETDSYPLPLNFRIGISGELIDTEKQRFTFGIDAIHPNDNTEAVNSGVEYAINEMFFIRGGYANLFREEAEENYSVGLGLNYRIWQSSSILKIDYSFTNFNRLGEVQRLSFGFKF
ncbi:MAG: PorV/PorQ family protein [Candidatus Marinimicrobia bacterium]|nr:PorV/PorQ family protein [Candidatus Neomarinimicrobiota bacterium]